MSKLDQLRAEIDLLKFRLKTARDKEILLLTRLVELEKLHEQVLEQIRGK